MATAAAAPALIERVEPNWAMSSTATQASRAGVGQARPLLAEEQDAAPRQVVGLQRHRPRQVVDADQRQAAVVPGGPLDQGLDGLVVVLVLVAVGDHRAAPVPAAAADDVERLGVERVGGPDRPSRC